MFVFDITKGERDKRRYEWNQKPKANIKEKDKLLRENTFVFGVCRKVLRPKGQLVFSQNTTQIKPKRVDQHFLFGVRRNVLRPIETTKYKDKTVLYLMFARRCWGQKALVVTGITPGRLPPATKQLDNTAFSHFYFYLYVLSLLEKQNSTANEKEHCDAAKCTCLQQIIKVYLFTAKYKHIYLQQNVKVYSFTSKYVHLITLHSFTFTFTFMYFHF